MEKGISLYPGLGMTREELVGRVEQAAQKGMTRLFLSFHIPETNEAAFQKDIDALFEAARCYDLNVVGDLVPGRPIPEALTHLRLDDGFTPERIKELQTRYPQKTLVLNASTVTEGFLLSLEKAGVDVGCVEALHNFYPRPHTGLSEAFFLRQNALCHHYGIKVGAFVRIFGACRGPLFKGLSTLEIHRTLDFFLALQHLRLLGTDAFYIGDDGATEDELDALAQLDDVLTLTLLTEKITALHEKLAACIFTLRPDEAEEVLRAQNSRALFKEMDIPPFTLKYLPQGTVTLDNRLAGRYAGEVEITLTDLPADPSVNVMGRVSEEERFLLGLMRGGARFRFRLVTKAAPIKSKK